MTFLTWNKKKQTIEMVCFRMINFENTHSAKRF